jgi:site-specific DNA-methyltransferase (adenine-specific)
MPRKKKLVKGEIETVAIDAVQPDPFNARRHNQPNLTSIRKSLESFGQQSPLIVDRSGKILKGNGTWMAAKALGWRQIKIVRSDLRGKKAQAYSLTDNKSSDLAGWETDVLAQSLSDMSADTSFDFAPSDFGWSTKELETLSKTLEDDEEKIEEAVKAEAEMPDAARTPNVERAIEAVKRLDDFERQEFREWFESAS